MCWDAGEPLRNGGVAIDPVGPTGPHPAMRGGAHNAGSYYLHGSLRILVRDPPEPLSFRVVCGAPGSAAGNGGPDAALAAISGAIERHPDSARGYVVRADLQILRGRWSDALPDCLAAVERQPANHWLWHRAATLLAFLQEKDRYRAHCRRMLRRFGATSDPYLTERLVKSCLLLPGAAEDTGALVNLATRSATREAGGVNGAWFQGARALALYRAGRPQEAVQACAESRKLGAGGAPHLAIQNDLVESLARRRLGQDGPARACLARARKRAESLPPFEATLGLSVCWQDHLVVEVLLREASAPRKPAGQ
jgi:hypothetical protein